MLKNWDNNILEIFFIWIGILIFLELTAPRWIVGITLMLMATFLMSLTLIPRHKVAYVHRPRSVFITRSAALLLFVIGVIIRLEIPF